MIKKQHTIPHFMLRSFGSKVFVANLETMTTTVKNARNATVIDKYYEHDSRKENEIENRLSLLESDFSQVYKKIITNYSGNQTLDQRELSLLLTFLSIQSIRTISDEILLNSFSVDKYEEWGKNNLKSNDPKKDKLNKIEELLDVKWNILYDLYIGKHSSNIKKNNIDTTRIEDDYKAALSVGFEGTQDLWRHAIDLYMTKIFILDHTKAPIIISSLFSGGGRNKRGHVTYYLYPFSPNRSVLILLSEYHESAEHHPGLDPIKDLIKTQPKINFEKENFIPIIELEKDERDNIFLPFINELRGELISSSENQMKDFLSFYHNSKEELGDESIFKNMFKCDFSFIFDKK